GALRLGRIGRNRRAGRRRFPEQRADLASADAKLLERPLSPIRRAIRQPDERHLVAANGHRRWTQRGRAAGGDVRAHPYLPRGAALVRELRYRGNADPVAHSAPDRARFLRSDRDRRRGDGYGAQGLVPLHAALQPVEQPGGDPALRPGVGWPANGLAADRAVSRRCEAAARRCAVRDGTPLGREAAAASRGLMPAKHIVGIPSWYGTARGPGGGYFRDQAL